MGGCAPLILYLDDFLPLSLAQILPLLPAISFPYLQTLSARIPWDFVLGPLLFSLDKGFKILIIPMP